MEGIEKTDSNAEIKWKRDFLFKCHKAKWTNAIENREKIKITSVTN